MLLPTTRAAAVLLIVPAALLHPRYLRWSVIPEVQLVLASVVVMALLFVDVLVGLALGMAILLCYARSSQMYLLPPVMTDREGGLGGVLMQYITPKHLKDAQNNVVDDRNYSRDMVGVEGVYGERVYGAQGIAEGGQAGVLAGFEPSVGGPVNPQV